MCAEVHGWQRADRATICGATGTDDEPTTCGTISVLCSEVCFGCGFVVVWYALKRLPRMYDMLREALGQATVYEQVGQKADSTLRLGDIQGLWMSFPSSNAPQISA